MVSILPSHFYNGVFPGLFDQCISVEHPRSEMNRGETTKPETHRPRLLVKPGDYVNPVPRFFSFSNMAVVGEKTLAHSELKLSLIGAFPGACTHALCLVYRPWGRGWELGRSCPLKNGSEPLPPLRFKIESSVSWIFPLTKDRR